MYVQNILYMVTFFITHLLRFTGHFPVIFTHFITGQMCAWLIWQTHFIFLLNKFGIKSQCECYHPNSTSLAH